MAELIAARRNRLASSQFGEPKERKYPMPDKAHARNAKARASAQYRKGNLSRTEYDRINRKADLMLYGGSTRERGHVYVVDDSGRGATRGKVKPDSQPDYRIKPRDPRRAVAKPRTKPQRGT